MCNIYLPIIYVWIFDLIHFGRLELVFLPLCSVGIEVDIFVKYFFPHDGHGFQTLSYVEHV